MAEAIAFHRAFYPTWDQIWANELLAMFGLVGDRRLSRLSKGEMGKLMMLLALAQRPELLVLDEPTDGLDPNQKNEVRALIKNMAVEKAVILSTHILEEVDAICTRVIIISQGKVVADVTPAQLRARKPGARLDEIFRDLTRGDI